jgi:hypothetical protein
MKNIAYVVIDYHLKSLTIAVIIECKAACNNGPPISQSASKIAPPLNRPYLLAF